LTWVFKRLLRSARRLFLRKSLMAACLFGIGLASRVRFFEKNVNTAVGWFLLLFEKNRLFLLLCSTGFVLNRGYASKLAPNARNHDRWLSRFLL
jgi:hypothetical protein